MTIAMSFSPRILSILTLSYGNLSTTFNKVFCLKSICLLSFYMVSPKDINSWLRITVLIAGLVRVSSSYPLYKKVFYLIGSIAYFF